MKSCTRVASFSLLILLNGAGCDAGGANTGPDDADLPDPAPARVEAVADYRDWGWEAFVLENDIVRLAAVPVIGGRVMEFSLNDHESMWVNSNALGSTPAPSAGLWPNHGGYKNWPAPQSRWNWPPPSVLDYGSYGASIVTESADSVSIHLASGIEQFRAPGLRFERTITLYKGTSIVRVEQRIVNETTSNATWGIWDITQTLAQHSPARDFDNFRVYFPINPNSRYGATGVRTDRGSEAWAGEAVEGIYEVRFRPDNAKLFADSRAGWVAYVDLRDGYAYVKRFPVFNEETYPDQGADVEVYVSNQNYFEVEVLSPLVDLPAGGGSYTFTETWAATRTDGPILDVNEVGLVTSRLSRDASNGRIRGRFGVFVSSLAFVVLLDEDGEEIARSNPVVALPSEHLQIDVSMDAPAEAARAEVVLEDGDGRRLGVLDAVTL